LKQIYCFKWDDGLVKVQKYGIVFWSRSSFIFPSGQAWSSFFFLAIYSIGVPAFFLFLSVQLQHYKQWMGFFSSFSLHQRFWLG